MTYSLAPVPASQQCRARNAGHICTLRVGHDGKHSCFCDRYDWEPTA